MRIVETILANIEETNLTMHLHTTFSLQEIMSSTEHPLGTRGPETIYHHQGAKTE